MAKNVAHCMNSCFAPTLQASTYLPVSGRNHYIQSGNPHYGLPNYAEHFVNT